MGGMLLSIAGRPPRDQAEATIEAALESGISFFDTADAYCIDDTEMHHNEKLLRAVLKERLRQVFIATKCGVRRPGGAWTVDARPETLRSAAEGSLKALGVDALDLLQLNAPDSRVPFADTIGALAKMREAGMVRHIGLCNVTVSQIEAALRIVPILTVQNRWNASDRSVESNGVLDFCQKNGLAFLAYSPFGGTRGAPALGTFGKLADLAKRRRVSPYRLLLAWMLARSPAAFPLIGARRPESIRDSARATALHLEQRDLEAVAAALVP